MGTNVVVVESPAKAKTIEKYLGKDFKVLASYGHVRDLLAKEGAVDPEHGYQMKYRVIERNEKHVDAIARDLRKADALYLATDPDREGEAISWHLCEILRERGLLENRPVYRVVFYEITARAIREAIQKPRELASDLVNAQQARRALDHLYGFTLSPLLWKKIKPGLSAGRVQSPALRMICERENEIEAFRRREYWSIEAEATGKGDSFVAKLVEYQGEKVVDSPGKGDRFSFDNGELAGQVRSALENAAGGRLRVTGVERNQRRRRPAPPFTTSTLQQEASRKLGFRARRTMSVAQRLYEGVDVGDGVTGLITYMRTDSVTLARDAVQEIRGFIGERYGPDSVPEKPNTYRTSAKNAQEAHEGIRPTSIRYAPEDIRRFLSDEEFRLYSLIWKRTVACQMKPAVYDMLGVDLAPSGEPAAGRFRATGSVLVEPGFIAVYTEGRDDAAEDDADVRLPDVREGDLLDLREVKANQHFTEPPPRYTEASLVKTLEEYGIGRPSTYATIISRLNDVGYVEMDGKRFIPTEIGRVVSSFLTVHFTRYLDYGFTAALEDELDAISRGERDWKPVLDNFWQPFQELVKDKETSVSREEAGQARDLGTDPKSGKPISVRMGRYGPFVQIGTREDEEKPRFAGLRPGQKMATISLEEALELFKLPRKLGTTAEGWPVSANIGRFGPYVQFEPRGADGKAQRKFVSIKEHDPYTITLDEAVELIRAKQEADANRVIHDFTEAGIQVLRGRFGPYITDKERNARVPKDREPETLTLKECQELLAQAPPRRGRGRRATGSTSTAARKAKKAPATPAPAEKVAKKKAAKKKTAKKKTATRKASSGKAATRAAQSASSGGGDSPGG
ncbi:MAG: DNA topoisomerase I [Chromatiales bacterium]|nr:DNA topoisomerase I [Chromatiales bacterium]